MGLFLKIFLPSEAQLMICFSHHYWFPVKTIQRVAFSMDRRGDCARSKWEQEAISTHFCTCQEGLQESSGMERRREE